MQIEYIIAFLILFLTAMASTRAYCRTFVGFPLYVISAIASTVWQNNGNDAVTRARISGIGWAGYLVTGKVLFKATEISALGNTAFIMAMGTALLTSSAYFVEGVSLIPMSGWLIIIWLGVVNTALAFFLWNHALETLEAFELSVLQNTMLIQITVLSFLFLGETLHLVKYIYLALVFIGVYIVQSRRVPGAI